MSAWRTRCGVLAIACACLFLAPRIVAASHHTVASGHGTALIGHGPVKLHLGNVLQRRFHHPHSQKCPAASFESPARNRVDEPPDDASATDPSADASSVALLLAPRPRAPDLIPEPLPSQISAGFKSAPLLAAVAPRPPPVL